MNILITGGSGYLANRIGKYLSQNPSHNVILASQKKEYNKHRLSRFINWKSDSSIKQLCNGIDVIIHAAGYNLGDSEKTPYESINFSRLSMQKLFNCSAKNNKTKIIFLSTAHVYKMPLIGRINENVPTTNEHPYALSNLAGESELLKNCKIYENLDGIILRISNCFGLPNSLNDNGWNLVVNSMCLDAIKNKKILIQGPRDTVRNFLPISRFLKILEFFVLQDNPKLNGDIFNVGYKKSHTIQQIAKIIQSRCRKLYNFSPSIRFDSNTMTKHTLYYDSIKGMGTIDDSDSFSDEIDSILVYLKNQY